MKNANNKNKIKLFLLALVTICIMVWIVINHVSIEQFIGRLYSAIIPFLYGLGFAYILNPICNKIEKALDKKRHKDNNTIAIVITETLFISLIVLICITIIPQSYMSIRNLIQSGPEMIESLQDSVDIAIQNNKVLADMIGVSNLSISDTVSNFFNKTIIPNLDLITSSLVSKVTELGTLLINLIIGLIVNIFALYNRKTFAKQIKILILAIFSKDNSNVIFRKLDSVSTKFIGFFIGKIIDSAIVGIICFIVLSIMQMPYTLLVSVIVGITNIVPIVGPFIGAVPSFIIILSESPQKALYFLIFIIILQQVDGHIIGPKCIGSKTGLNTFWVLFAIICFGKVFGIFGMIIGVPVFAVIYDIVRDIIQNVLKRKNINIDSIGDNEECRGLDQQD